MDDLLLVQASNNMEMGKRVADHSSRFAAYLALFLDIRPGNITTRDAPGSDLDGCKLETMDDIIPGDYISEHKHP